MSKICRICQKEFETLSQFGGNRQFCYECVPSDLDRQERTNEKRRAIKKRALSLLVERTVSLITLLEDGAKNIIFLERKRK